MFFHSLVFALFALVFFALWPWVRSQNRPRWAFLVGASFVFYGWWDWRFLSLILASGLLDFGVGLGMRRWPAAKKRLLALSILGNLGVLGTFKYLAFFTHGANRVLEAAGGDPIPVVSLVLPVGISFYTFQSMSYTIDVYREKLEPTRSVLHFFAYLALFPQLVAGPIVRATELLDQLREGLGATPEQRWAGVRLLSLGFFKKVVIADNLAPFVDAAFGRSVPVESGALWWVITTLFAFQIYCDFSGYTDIARGLGKWMGYDFPNNFDHPYGATSLRAFWQRWHITLSTWFRDYLYVPLGGSRNGALLGHRNLWITMLVAGLWHGAAWSFVVWGALHALFLSVERLTQWPKRALGFPGGRAVAWSIVMLQIWLAWVFFRAENLEQGARIVALLFDPSRFNLSAAVALGKTPFVFLAAGVLLEAYYLLNLSRWTRFSERPVLEAVVLSLVAAACVFFRGPGHAFVYFQF